MKQFEGELLKDWTRCGQKVEVKKVGMPEGEKPTFCAARRGARKRGHPQPFSNSMEKALQGSGKDDSGGAAERSP